jgi:hypothetical protein
VALLGGEAARVGVELDPMVGRRGTTGKKNVVVCFVLVL